MASDIDAYVETLRSEPEPELTLAQGVERLNESDRPQPESVRGKCPECGDDLVSNLYYVGGRGYLIRFECWSSLGANPTCAFYKVI